MEADKKDDSDIEETYEKESCNPQSVMSKLEDEKTPKLLLATITIITQSQTSKLKGHIKKSKVTVLTIFLLTSMLQGD